MSKLLQQIETYFRREDYDQVVYLIKNEIIPEKFSPEIVYMYSFSLYMLGSKMDSYIFLKKMSKQKLLNNEANTLFMWTIYECVLLNKDLEINVKQIATKFIIQNSLQDNLSPYEEAIILILREENSNKVKDYENLLEWVNLLKGNLFKVWGNLKNENYKKNIVDWYKIKIEALSKRDNFEECSKVIDRFLEDLAKIEYKIDSELKFDLLYLQSQYYFRLKNYEKAYNLLMKLTLISPEIKVYIMLLKVNYALEKYEVAKISAIKMLLYSKLASEDRDIVLTILIRILYSEKNYKECFSHVVLLNNNSVEFSEDFLNKYKEFQNDLLSEEELKNYWSSSLNTKESNIKKLDLINWFLGDVNEEPKSINEKYDKLKIFYSNSWKSCMNCSNYTDYGECELNGYIKTEDNYYCERFFRTSIQIFNGGSVNPK